MQRLYNINIFTGAKTHGALYNGSEFPINAHCPKKGAKSMSSNFDYIYIPLFQIMDYIQKGTKFCIASNLLFEKTHIWVLLVKFDSSLEIQLF